VHVVSYSIHPFSAVATLPCSPLVGQSHKYADIFMQICYDTHPEEKTTTTPGVLELLVFKKYFHKIDGKFRKGIRYFAGSGIIHQELAMMNPPRSFSSGNAD